jgi:FlaA1/EpsC-like NDP-sugar epimerase
VTHPQTTRYLMTAAEAAGLAIVAGALGDPGGVFSIDPGPPVRVLDIATRLAHSVPADIGVEFIGLRPGERLHEQMFSASDEISETPCDRVLRSSLREVDPAWLDSCVATLERQVERASAAGVRGALAEMHKVPEPNAERTQVGVL